MVGVGVVVVVNCEGGVVMTGYDATTAERRGQVVRLRFSTNKYFFRRIVEINQRHQKHKQQQSQHKMLGQTTAKYIFKVENIDTMNQNWLVGWFKSYP